MSAALPKPARVEKWQRWRDSKGVEFTAIESCGKSPGGLLGGLLDRWLLRKDGSDAKWFGVNMLKDWTFLGYAKPDKVEMGQRWRLDGKHDHVVGAGFELVYRGPPPYPHHSKPNMLTSERWEYLGMAESADASSQEAESVKRAVAEEQRRMLEVDVEKGLHADAAPRIPITKKVDPKAEARRANEEAAKRLIANPPSA